MKPPKTKICTKCGNRKKLEGFHRNCIKKDGLTSLCKLCNSLASKRRYTDKAYREKIQAYRDAHKERTKAYNKAYKAKDPIGTAIRAKAERERNAETYKAHYIRKIQDPILKKKKNNLDKAWRKRHATEITKKHKVEVASMSDNYVKNKICGYMQFHGIHFVRSDIAPKMVQIWREYMIINRMLKKKGRIA